ncbi:MAG: DsrE family protein [Gemmatimonadota bacterium]|nr:DsrE family protein [Gemmatimonadota bacterium]
MSERKKLVIVISRGFDDERASVAWSIASGGVSSGLDVTIFLVSSGVDWARKGAGQGAHINPFDPPMSDMIRKVMDAGCQILVCPPCSKVRGFGEAEYMDDVVITGSGAIHELIADGAATLCF